MKRTRQVFLAVTCFTTGAGQVLSGDAPADWQGLTLLTLEELVNIPVSIASRSDKTVLSAPSNVSVYRQTDFIAMGIRTLDELLNFIPGIQTQREDQNLTSVIVRGRRSGPDSNGVLMLLDGVRLNDALNGGPTAGFSFMGLETLDRVEVIRGPGSALYGSNAMVGVINLITKKDTNEIYVSGGTHAAKEIAFNYAEQFGDLNISANIHGYDDNGKTYPPFFSAFGVENDTNDPLSRLSSTVKLGYKNLTLMLGHQYQRTEDFTSGGSLGPGNDAQRSNVNMVIARAQLTIPINSHELELYAQNIWTEWDFIVRLFPGAAADILVPLNDPNQPLFWTDGSEVDALGGNRRTGNSWATGAHGAFSLAEEHQLRVSVSYQHEHTSKNPFQGNWDSEIQRQTNGKTLVPLPPGQINAGFYGPAGEIVFVDPTDRNILSASAQIESRLTDNANLTFGGRYDHYNDVGGNLSLRGALVYQLNAKTNFKAIYGEAFRPPTLLENYANFSSLAVGNPDARPESLKTFEVTASRQLGPIQFSATWFHTRFNDPILPTLVEDIVTGFNAFIYDNNDDFSSNGWEFEALAAFNNGLSIRAGYSTFNIEEKIGAAENLAFTSITYAEDRFTWNLNAYHHSKVLSRKADGVEFNTDVYVPSLTKLNTKVAYRIQKNLEFSVSVENLLNETYTSFTSQARLEHGIPARGRQVIAGLRWRY